MHIVIVIWMVFWVHIPPRPIRGPGPEARPIPVAAATRRAL